MEGRPTSQRQSPERTTRAKDDEADEANEAGLADDADEGDEVAFFP